MSFNFKTGGSWETLASGWVKVAGTWEQVQSAWVKVAGTWQQVYASYNFEFSSLFFGTGTTSDEQGIIFNSDGTIDRQLNGSVTQAGYWTSTPAEITGDEQVRITSVTWNSGSTFSTAAAAEDVWVDISTNPAWKVQDVSSGAPGAQNVDLTFEGRPIASGGATTSAAVNINADWEI